MRKYLTMRNLIIAAIVAVVGMLLYSWWRARAARARISGADATRIGDAAAAAGAAAAAAITGNTGFIPPGAMPLTTSGPTIGAPIDPTSNPILIWSPRPQNVLM
ncbi:MAG TPA: hypothetical protein VF814_04630 [Casimicrobiaceae bacterium]